MNQPVTLKGVKSGIILKLSDEGDFEKLLPDIRKKFKESASFFGNRHMILSIEGRDVDDEEAAEILKLLVENTRLKVDTIMVQDRVLEDKFQDILGEDPRHEIEIARLRKDNATLLKAIGQLTSALDPMNIQVHKGTLRGGNDIHALGSVMILGDVKPGATVTAGGSIFVMGSLQGTADAGAYGDAEAFVMAFNMDPLQIRISDAIAVSQEKTGKRRRGFMRPKDEVIPEVAAIVDGHIVIQDFDSTFIKGSTFFKKSKKMVGPLMDAQTEEMLAFAESVVESEEAGGEDTILTGESELGNTGEVEIDFAGQGSYDMTEESSAAKARPEEKKAEDSTRTNNATSDGKAAGSGSSDEVKSAGSGASGNEKAAESRASGAIKADGNGSSDEGKSAGNGASDDGKSAGSGSNTEEKTTADAKNEKQVNNKNDKKRGGFDRKKKRPKSGRPSLSR